MTSAKKESDKNSLERSLRRLEDIVDQLERSDIPLEDSLQMYEEGIALSKACVETLAKAELKVKRLSKDMKNNFELIDDESEQE